MLGQRRHAMVWSGSIAKLPWTILIVSLFVLSSCARPMVQNPLASSSGPSPSSQVPACPDISPPCPPIQEAGRLGSKLVLADGNITLLPAPEGEPQVGADDAVARAWFHGAKGYGGSGAQPVYATLPAGVGIPQDTPIWDVRFFDACIPALGGAALDPSSSPSPCPPQEWHVIIDATSGEFIEAFSN